MLVGATWVCAGIRCLSKKMENVLIKERETQIMPFLIAANCELRLLYDLWICVHQLRSI